MTTALFLIVLVLAVAVVMLSSVIGDKTDVEKVLIGELDRTRIELNQAILDLEDERRWGDDVLKRLESVEEQ